MTSKDSLNRLANGIADPDPKFRVDSIGLLTNAHGEFLESNLPFFGQVSERFARVFLKQILDASGSKWHHALLFRSKQVRILAKMATEVNENLTDWKTASFEERVREAFNGASLVEIAEKTGYKYHTLRNYLKLHRDIPPEVLIRLSNLTKCSIHWLLTGDGSKYIEANILPEGESPVYFGEAEQEIIRNLAVKEGFAFEEQVRVLVLESLKARGLVTDQVQGVDLLFFGKEVPTLKAVRLWGEIAAGKPIDVCEGFETVLVPEEFLTPGRENFALRVRGDSMEDEGILEGDIIICYESNVANNGDTVVALIDGSQATVKKFYKERNQIRLQPKSKKHEPIFLSPDRVQIQGIVTGIFRRTV